MQRLVHSSDIYFDLDMTQKYLKENFLLSCIKHNITFHAYWHGTFKQKQFDSVASFLVHHKDIYLWLDVQNGYANWKQNDLLELLANKYNVRISLYDPKTMIRNTPLRNSSLPSKATLPLRSDYARYLILYKFGGVYFDLDVMCLKSLTPLLHFEFVYQWSMTKDGNNATMHMFKHSKTAKYVLQKCARLGNSMEHARDIFQDEDPNLSELMNLPSQLFDPLWIYYDRKSWTRPADLSLSSFDDFFKEKKTEDFFQHCFAYHWHGRWDANIHANSWYQTLVKKIKRNLSHEANISLRNKNKC